MNFIKDMFSKMDRKKMIIVFAGGLVIVFIIIVIALLLISSLSGSRRTYTYAENQLQQAAKNYYADNEKRLPQEVNAQITITAAQLTEGKYLEELTKITPEDTTCTGKVIVTKVNGGYNYTPYLDCGKNYKTSDIGTKIIESTSTVTIGEGLYQMNGEYVYRGENPNNYISFNGDTWRIVKIDSNNRLVLILDTPTEKSTWDDRYNVDKNQNYGINTYEVSRIYDAVNSIYSKMKSSSKLNMANFDACVGKRSSTATANDGSIECTTVLANQTISLIPIYDYINASLDSQCITATSASCENYNYLTGFNRTWWTLTATDENTYKAYKIESLGNPVINTLSSETYVRPVITLLSNSLYESGTGTSSNPYKIK